MRHRYVLTLIWIASFLLVLGVAESYVHTRNAEGQRHMLPEDRPYVLKPVAVLYGSYLAGILAVWFLKPLRAPRSSQMEQRRYRIALVCTLAFNGVVLFLAARPYMVPAGLRDVEEAVGWAVRVAGWLSFIVAPVNGFYFGAGRE